MKKMNTTKKIVVALAVMMVVAAMAAPAAMGDEAPYTATVRSGQDTTVSVIDGAFGNVLADSTDNKKVATFLLTNSGDWDAYVDAAFSTQGTGAGAGTYGLVGVTNTTKVIAGTNFKLDPDGAGAGAKIPLTADTVDTPIGTVTKSGGTMTPDAYLDVPAAQTAQQYSGTVLLTFSNTESGGY